MKRDYLDLGSMRFDRRNPDVLEAYSGTSIVAWQGKIERQLDELIKEYSDVHNPGYVDKLRALLAVWRANPLSGSVNVETLRTLLAPVEVSAVDPWKLQNYFSQLRDSLKQLVASVEELPPGALNGEPIQPEMNHIPPPDSSMPPAQEFGHGEEPPPEEGDADKNSIAAAEDEEGAGPTGRRTTSPATP